jgi:hypothetical protein
MKHLNLNATAEQKQALANEIVESGLDQKVRDIKQYNSSFAYEDGDILDVEGGYATPHTFNNNGEETKYLAFDGIVTRGQRKFDVVVPVRTLTSPTFSLAKQDSYKRSDLGYRYGRQILDFEEVENKGKATMLAKMPTKLRCKITVAKTAYLPDFDSYDTVSKTWSRAQEAQNYGYFQK